MIDCRRIAAVLFAASTAALPAAAQEWPTQPVRLINPFTAGAATDVVARVTANALSQKLGQQVIVENRTGAAGIIGSEAVARSKPDGYTILVGTPGSMGINPFLYKTISYNAEKDFIPVVHLVSFPQLLAANPSLPVKTVPELIEYVKQRPGKVNYGSSGSGSTAHLAIALMLSTAKIDMLHIPFRGGTPMIQALAANEVQFAVEGLPSLAGPIQAGQIRPIAVTSTTRSPTMPDVPAIAETLPGFDTAAWVILFVPTGTPEAIVQKLSRESIAVLNQPETRTRMAELGATVAAADQPATAAFHKKELAKWEEAVRISGAKAE